MKTATIRAALIISVFAIKSASAQGDLAPSIANGALDPAGNPQPSMKTLQELYDRIGELLDDRRIPIGTVPASTGYQHHITQPGSYVLTGHLDVTASLAGIRVAVPDVTIDLNGFTIQRTAGSAGHAIQVDAAAHRCTIENGRLAGGTVGSGFQYGILCVGSGFPISYARGGSIADVAASGFSKTAIIAGESWLLRGCTAHDNFEGGIWAQTGCVLDRCTASAITRDFGIYADKGSTLTHCNVYDCTAAYGIRALAGCTLTGCSAQRISHSGATTLIAISGGDGSVLTGCNASFNTHTGSGEATGIRAGVHCTLTNCNASNNSSTTARAYGIFTGDGCALENCTASGNSHTGEFDGFAIRAGSGSSLANCSAFANASSGFTARGISANYGSTLTNCTANANSHTGGGTGSGITAVGSTLTNCTANANTSTSKTSCGFFVADKSSLTSCKATDNHNTSASQTGSTGIGIWAENYTAIRSCTASGNDGDGIYVYSFCQITDSHCADNGGSGIHALLNRNFIADNFVADNTTGIYVDSASDDTLVIRNIFLQNTTSTNVSAGSVSPLGNPFVADPLDFSPHINFSDD